MSDLFSDHATGLDSPAANGHAITPDDNLDLENVTRFIYVGSTGDISIILANDDAPITIPAAPAGYHPLRIKRVLATGTTATGIVGFR